MNRATAFFIALLALAIGGYLFWDGRQGGNPSTSTPAPSEAAPPSDDGAATPSVPSEDGETAGD